MELEKLAEEKKGALSEQVEKVRNIKLYSRRTIKPFRVE